MNNNDPFAGLFEKLKASTDWPKIYMFKFICPADNQSIAKVQELFNSKEAQISMRNSKNGNYIAFTAKEMMMSPEAVIERYKKAAEIEGIISL
jgi:hypothetical protein